MANETKRRHGNERTVLLVGGTDVDLRRDARVLQGAGYRVKTAPSGLHAQRCLENEPIAIVITEQDMQGIDGVGLLVLVKSRWPKTRRVILTARPRGELVMQAKMLADARTLIRPVKPDKLLTVVKQELDAYEK